MQKDQSSEWVTMRVYHHKNTFVVHLTNMFYYFISKQLLISIHWVTSKRGSTIITNNFYKSAGDVL